MLRIESLVFSIALLPTALLAQARPLVRGTVVTEEAIGVTVSRIWGVTVGPGGRVAAVLSPGPQLVIVRGTEPPTVFSRAGSGPGELRNASAIGWIGDTLWVGDGILGRVTLFTATGTLVRSIPAPGSMTGAPVLLRGGQVALLPMTRVTVEQQPPAPERVLRVSAGRASDTLLTTIAQNRTFAVTMSQGQIVGQQAFDDFPLLRAFPNGSGFVVVRRPIGSGGKSTFAVERYSETGRRLFERAYTYTPVPLLKRDIDDVVAKFVADFEGSPDGFAGKIEQALFRPPFLPPVNAVVPGQDGTIWIQRERTTAALGKWTLLNTSGVAVGDFLIPTTLEVRSGTAAGVWGVESDADGLPSIVEYRVPR